MELNRENVIQVFEDLVRMEKTWGNKSGRLKRPTNLSEEDIQHLFQLIVDGEEKRYQTRTDPTIKGHFDIYYTFSNLRKDWLKFRKMGYGFPDTFREEMKTKLGVTSLEDEKWVDSFLLTGLRLCISIDFFVITNAIRKDEYAMKNMKKEMEEGNRLFDLLGLSREIFRV